MRILLLDACHESAIEFKAAIEHAGAECLYLKDLTKAVCTTVEYEPDLIIIESKSVNDDTLNIVKAIRNSEHTHNPPVVFISAESATKTELHGIHIGCIEYVNHSVCIQTLVSRLIGYNCITSMRKIAKELSCNLSTLEAKYTC